VAVAASHICSTPVAASTCFQNDKIERRMAVLLSSG
jgi:hypothetical protein